MNTTYSIPSHRTDDAEPPPRHPGPRWRERFIQVVTSHPRAILAAWAIVLVASLVFLPRLEKDTSVEAYIPPDDPALGLRRETMEAFGLQDPVVILVDTGTRMGVFTPETLRLVQWLTERSAMVEGINPDSVASIATEERIRGTEQGIEVNPLMGSVPDSPAEAAEVREAVMDFPPVLGTLVARDGSAAVISARLAAPEEGAAVYRDLQRLVQEAPRHGERVYVAGEAVLGEHLGEYLDRDARRLNPLAVVVIGVVLFFAYHTWRGMLLPLLAAGSGIAVAFGVMALMGIPHYLLTNVLPAVLLAIGVAYGLHLIGEYYERASGPSIPDRTALVVDSTLRMWRPVMFTAFTDVAGFADLAITTPMPPMQRFGLFACLGALVTLAFTLTAIPAALMLLPVRVSRTMRAHRDDAEVAGDPAHRVVNALGRSVVRHRRKIVAAAAVLSVIALAAATRLRVDENRVGNFDRSEPIYEAVTVANRVLDGTVVLDVLVEADEPEGLLRPDNLRRLEDLQRFAATVPKVGGSQSVVDFLKEIVCALAGGEERARAVPDSEELAAQALLVASLGGLEGELSHFIDSEHRRGIVRIYYKSGRYSDIREAWEALDGYVRAHFNGPGIRARLSGRMSVYYAWMRGLGVSHFVGVGIALITVWVMIGVGFRSFWAGLFAVVPVSATLLAIYGVMGVTGIWLRVGTSAFAAICIGLTVDFAIHVLDHLVVLTRDRRLPLAEAVPLLFPSTGRAVFFSFLCIFLGITVLTQSRIPPIFWFATLLAVSLLASFLTSLILLPALLLVVKPRFLRPNEEHRPGVERCGQGKEVVG